MERSMKTLLMTLLLVPALAIAQDDYAAEEAEPMEEAAEPAEPAEEAPADEEEQAPRTLVDLFYVPSSTLRLRSGGNVSDEDGDGMGARAFMRFSDHYAVTGEYQTLTFETGPNDEYDADQIRVGVGFAAESSAGSIGSFTVEYDQFESEELGDLDGFSLQGRMHGPLIDTVQAYGGVGYFMLEADSEDVTGFEFIVGAVVRAGPVGLFADFRRTTLNGETSNARTSLADARAGLRFMF